MKELKGMILDWIAVHAAMVFVWALEHGAYDGKHPINGKMLRSFETLFVSAIDNATDRNWRDAA